MELDIRNNIKELEEAIDMYSEALQKSRKYMKYYMIAAVVFLIFSVVLIIASAAQASMYSLLLAVFLAIVAGIYKSKVDKIRATLLELNHQKNFEDAKLYNIGEINKKRICKYCGTYLSEEDYIDRKCPNCGNSKFDR